MDNENLVEYLNIKFVKDNETQQEKDELVVRDEKINEVKNDW